MSTMYLWLPWFLLGFLSVTLMIFILLPNCGELDIVPLNYLLLDLRLLNYMLPDILWRI